MIMLTLAMLISVIAGMLIAYAVFPVDRKNPAALAFLLCIGAGLGTGVSSILYFLMLAINMAGYAIAADLLFSSLILLVIFSLHKKGLLSELAAECGRKTATISSRIITIVFGGVLISSIVSTVIGLLKEPHGRWDAWLIWNMHARFIYRSGENWRDMFAGGLDWTHADYPLMLPLSVVRSWIYQGGEGVHAPMLLAMLFSLAVIGLLVSSVVLFRRQSQGFLAGLALMGSPFFIILTIYQVADIPLAFFILATIVACYISDRGEKYNYRALLLAGIAAGMACWTKNEGLLFLAAAAAGRMVLLSIRSGWKSSFRQTFWLLTGALPPLLAVIYFKAGLAPSGDLFSGQSVQQIIQRLTDSQRYTEIIKAFFLTAITFTQGVVNIRSGISFNPAVIGVIPLAAYMALTGLIADRRERSAALNALAMPLIMLAGFFAVYLVTPHDLRWHLFTSLNRLFMQVWPCLIFVCFMLAGTEEDSPVQKGAENKVIGKGAEPAASKKKRANAAKGGR